MRKARSACENFYICSQEKERRENGEEKFRKVTSPSIAIIARFAVRLESRGMHLRDSPRQTGTMRSVFAIESRDRIRIIVDYALRVFATVGT